MYLGVRYLKNQAVRAAVAFGSVLSGPAVAADYASFLPLFLLPIISMVLGLLYRFEAITTIPCDLVARAFSTDQGSWCQVCGLWIDAANPAHDGWCPNANPPGDGGAGLGGGAAGAAPGGGGAADPILNDPRGQAIIAQNAALTAGAGGAGGGQPLGGAGVLPPGAALPSGGVTAGALGRGGIPGATGLGAGAPAGGLGLGGVGAGLAGAAGLGTALGLAPPGTAGAVLPTNLSPEAHSLISRINADPAMQAALVNGTRDLPSLMLDKSFSLEAFLGMRQAGVATVKEWLNVCWKGDRNTQEFRHASDKACVLDRILGLAQTEGSSEVLKELTSNDNVEQLFMATNGRLGSRRMLAMQPPGTGTLAPGWLTNAAQAHTRGVLRNRSLVLGEGDERDGTGEEIMGRGNQSSRPSTPR